jgi:large subunit ribosomal protein L14e
MAVFDIGRVCRKTSGLDAGKLCVVLSKDKNFATIVGPNIKKTKVNLRHLEPLPNMVKAGKDASQAEATELLKNEGLIL